MPEIKQEYTGTWIPAIIMLNENLSPMEKLLYAEIASFQQCWASNDWLGARLGISGRSIRTGIKKLKDMLLITVVETENSRVCAASVQILPPPLENISTPLENISTPLENISIKNNNINNIKKKLHTSAYADDGTGLSSEGAADKDSARESSAARAAHLEKVFKAVAMVVHEGRPILYTDTRKAHLNRRLKTFKPTEIVKAANNLMKSDWHLGQNPQQKVYATYDFLMRSDEQVEKWLHEEVVTQKKAVF